MSKKALIAGKPGGKAVVTQKGKIKTPFKYPMADAGGAKGGKKRSGSKSMGKRY
jgi:hypothetical protein